MTNAAVVILSMYNPETLPTRTPTPELAANLISYLTELMFTEDESKSLRVILEDNDVCIVINAIAVRYYSIFEDDKNEIESTEYNISILLKYLSVKLITEIRGLVK